VGGEISELVPCVVDGVDQAEVRAEERLLELEVIRRIGEDEVDGPLGQAGEDLHAVAVQDRVEGKVHWESASNPAVSNRSPGAIRAPRAQSAAGIRRLFSCCT